MRMPKAQLTIKTKKKPSKFNQKTASGPELKYSDLTVNANPTNNGTVALINVVAQGSDNTDRIGRKITFKSIEYDYVYQNDSAALGTVAAWPDNAACAKIAVVYDKQPNGALPAWSDIFTNTGSVMAPFGLKNINNIDRFDILMTDRVVIDNASALAQRVHRYLPVNLECRYDGTTSGIADITSGSLLFCYADDNTNNTNNSTILGRVRVLYTDD